MARQRSPSYPSLPLNQAIDLVEKIHKTCRTNIISREDAAREMGYSGLTGRSLTVLSALLQFGLLEKTGKGDVRVSRRAVDILHGIDQSERDEAKIEAALAPQLFRDIHDRFPDGIPSESAIKSFLIKQDFQDVAIGPAINAFLETYRWVGGIRVQEPQDELLEDEALPSTLKQANNGHFSDPPPSKAIEAVGSTARDFDLNKINMDIRGDKVLISGFLDLKGIRLLEKRLVGLKALLEPLDDTSADLETQEGQDLA